MSDPGQPAASGSRLTAAALHLALKAGEVMVRRTLGNHDTAYPDARQFPWIRDIETHWRTLRTELDEVLAERERLPNFQDVSEEQRSITDDDRWKVFVFRVFGTPVGSNCARCPLTAAALERIPGLQNAMFSILAPGKRIPPHRGPYKGLLRYHLALKVPHEAARCTIVVDGEPRHWCEGRTLILDDSYMHSVSNETDEERVVLFADFIRPLPPLRATLNRWLVRRLANSPLGRRPLQYLATRST